MNDIIKRGDSLDLTPYSGDNGNPWESDVSNELFEARFFINRLLKRKYQILAIILAVIIPTAIFTYITTPLYTSSALIQINPDPVPVLPYKEISDLPTAATPYEMYMTTQRQVLQGPSLTACVRDRLSSEPESEAVRAEIPFLSQRLEIRRIEQSQLFEISYSAAEPEAARDIVNIYAEEYIKEVFHSRQATREKAREMLENELKGLESKVAASDNELNQYAQDHNITGAEPGQTNLVEQKMEMLATQQTNIEAELASAKSRVESIKNASIDKFPDQYLTESLSSLRTQVFQLEKDLSILRITYDENWPEVIKRRNELDLIRDQINSEQAAALAQALDQAEMDLSLLENRYQLISISMNEQQKLVDQYHDALVQYNILRREVETNQNLYEGILERLQQTSVTAGLEFGNVHIVEPGTVRNKPSSPKIIWNLCLAALAGLALGICFALVMDFWDNSISNLEELESMTHLPVLGYIPRIKPIKTRLALVSENVEKPESGNPLTVLSNNNGNDSYLKKLKPEAFECIRNIYASILLSKSDLPPRIIMVTSATPSEGKSTLVTYLGSALAESGNNTLLVESDMRKPVLSEILGIRKEGGLSLFLSGHINRSPKINDTSNPYLFAVSAGPQSPNPVALLNSEKMTIFLNEIPSSFKFILLDAPPLLAVADARVLCSKVDGVVLVVKARRTPRNVIRRATKLIESCGGNLLGVVLNDVIHAGSEYGYYNHYYQ